MEELKNVSIYYDGSLTEAEFNTILRLAKSSNITYAKCKLKYSNFGKRINKVNRDYLIINSRNSTSKQNWLDNNPQSTKLLSPTQVREILDSVETIEIDNYEMY